MTFELPAGLAEPLHILEPTWQKAVAFVLLALSLAVSLWLLRRWRRRTAEATPAPAAPPPPPVPSRAGLGIAGVIEALRKKYSKTDPRQGCHELSVVLREHFGKSQRRRRRPFLTLTAREVGSLLAKSRVRDFFYQLSHLQFRRQPPSPGELDAICDRAIEVVRKKG